MRALSPARAAALAVVANTGLLGLPLLLAGRALSGPVLCCAGLALLFSASEAAFQRGQDSPTLRPDPATILTGLVTLLIFWSALLFPAPAVGPAAWLGGAASMLLGICLRAGAMRALGPRFVSEARVLPPSAIVRSGLYRLARHPSEIGLLLIGTGAAVTTGSLPAALLVVFGLLPMTILRTHREDLVYALR